MNLLLTHELGTFFEALCTDVFHDPEPGGVWVTKSDPSADDHVNVLSCVAVVCQTLPSSDFHEFALLHNRCKIDRFKFSVGFEK